MFVYVFPGLASSLYDRVAISLSYSLSSVQPRAADSNVVTKCRFEFGVNVVRDCPFTRRVAHQGYACIGADSVDEVVTLHAFWLQMSAVVELNSDNRTKGFNFA